MQGLKDIKPLVNVPDNSLFWVVAIMIGILLVSILCYWWLKKSKRKPRRRISAKESAIQKLQTLDFSNTKEAVYTFSEAMHQVISLQRKDDFERLLKKLEVYKYKKTIPSLSNSDKEAMQSMIKELGNV